MKCTISGKVVQVDQREGMVVASLLQTGKGRPEIIGILYGKDSKSKPPSNGGDATVECSVFVGKKGYLTVFAV